MGSDCLSDPQKNSSITCGLSFHLGNNSFFAYLGSTDDFFFHLLFISIILGSLLYLGRGMETQDNGFILVIDGVRKEKERLTAAKKKKKKKKVLCVDPPA